MEYRILVWQDANDLKKSKNAEFIYTIESNKSNVFLLDDSTFLLMPFNPFGNSIQVKEKNVIENWVANDKFPITEEFNRFYYDNELVINNLNTHKEKLKEDLFNYVYKDPSNHPVDLNKQVIDEIYKYVKAKRKVDNYRLNFIVLVGDYLMGNNKKYKWGLYKSCQYINPVHFLAIVNSDPQPKCFNLEANLFTKHGYLGFFYVNATFKSDGFKPAFGFDEIIVL